MIDSQWNLLLWCIRLILKLNWISRVYSISYCINTMRLWIWILFRFTSLFIYNLMFIRMSLMVMIALGTNWILLSSTLSCPCICMNLSLTQSFISLILLNYLIKSFFNRWTPSIICWIAMSRWLRLIASHWWFFT